MSAKKFATALLAVTGVIAVSTLSSNASAPPDSTGATTTTTTTIATPVVAGCATTVSGATSTTVDEAFINLCDVVLTQKDEGYDDPVKLDGATFKCILCHHMHHRVQNGYHFHLHNDHSDNKS